MESDCDKEAEEMKRRFVAYFYRNGSGLVNLGVSLRFRWPELEIHLPFGFVRLGWRPTLPDGCDAQERFYPFTFGWDRGWHPWEDRRIVRL